MLTLLDMLLTLSDANPILWEQLFCENRKLKLENYVIVKQFKRSREAVSNKGKSARVKWWLNTARVYKSV